MHGIGVERLTAFAELKPLGLILVNEEQFHYTDQYDSWEHTDDVEHAFWSISIKWRVQVVRKEEEHNCKCVCGLGACRQRLDAESNSEKAKREPIEEEE